MPWAWRTAPALLVVALGACVVQGEVRPRDPVPSRAPVAAPSVVPSSEPTGEAEPESRPELHVEEADAPAPLAAPPTLAFVAPKQGESIAPARADAYLVRIETRGWFDKPGDHVHLVLDGRPYKAIEAPEASLRLGDVVPSEPLAPGEHVLCAYAAGADHVGARPSRPPSVRGGASAKGPLAMVSFWIGKPGRSRIGAAEPVLVYGRPKGTYNGAAADSVVLDFYLANVELGAGKHAVVATLAPEAGSPVTTRIDRWAPVSLAGLPEGTTRVTLQIVDATGNAVAGPFARGEGELNVNRAARAP